MSPLNESTRNTRDRWPLEFDLEGVPRDTAERQRLLREKHEPKSPTEAALSQNQFAVDYSAGDFITDINNPPKKHYNPRDPANEFPKMVYHHESGAVLTVGDGKEERASQKRGFQDVPSTKFDYSRIKNGKAEAVVTAPAPMEFTEEEVEAEK